MLQHTQILVFIIVCVNDIIIISPLFLLGKADDTLNGEQDREQKDPYFIFKADRPFIFMLDDGLFVGIVNDLTKD